jgi:sugar O-acyltransferase (sialic acid O-acetyltransferase NeuD family)
MSIQLKRKLLIFPYNGNGIEALDCIDENAFEFIGFIDDTPEKLAKQNPYPIFDRSVLQNEPTALVLAVPGSPTSYSFRKKVIDSLNIDSIRFATVIHPSAKIGKNVLIGKNTLIMAGVVLTSDAKIGNSVCILPNSVIHHDSIVNDYTLIGSNVVIAGGTIIEQNCYIGSGSNIINGIIVGEFSLIGMGTNVTKSVNKNAKMVGNPAKSL